MDPNIWRLLPQDLGESVAFWLAKRPEYKTARLVCQGWRRSANRAPPGWHRRRLSWKAIGYEYRSGIYHNPDRGDYLIWALSRPGLTPAMIRENDGEAIQYVAAQVKLAPLRYMVERFGLTAKDMECSDHYAIGTACIMGALDIVRYLCEDVGITKSAVLASNARALALAGNGPADGIAHPGVVAYLHNRFGVDA